MEKTSQRVSILASQKHVRSGEKIWPQRAWQEPALGPRVVGLGVDEALAVVAGKEGAKVVLCVTIVGAAVVGAAVVGAAVVGAAVVGAAVVGAAVVGAAVVGAAVVGAAVVGAAVVVVRVLVVVSGVLRLIVDAKLGTWLQGINRAWNTAVPFSTSAALVKPVRKAPSVIAQSPGQLVRRPVVS